MTTITQNPPSQRRCFCCDSTTEHLFVFFSLCFCVLVFFYSDEDTCKALVFKVRKERRQEARKMVSERDVCFFLFPLCSLLVWVLAKKEKIIFNTHCKARRSPRLNTRKNTKIQTSSSFDDDQHRWYRSHYNHHPKSRVRLYYPLCI